MFLPVRDGNSPQTRTKATVQSEHSLAFDDVFDGFVRGLFPVGVSTLGKAGDDIHLVLILGLDGGSGR